MNKLTAEQLFEIITQCAGEDESVSFDGASLDVKFNDLGYDSLALLETAGRISRDFDIQLSDDAVTDTRTPRSLLELVNKSIAEAA